MYVISTCITVFSLAENALGVWYLIQLVSMTLVTSPHKQALIKSTFSWIREDLCSHSTRHSWIIQGEHILTASENQFTQKLLWVFGNPFLLLFGSASHVLYGALSNNKSESEIVWACNYTSSHITICTLIFCTTVVRSVSWGAFVHWTNSLQICLTDSVRDGESRTWCVMPNVGVPCASKTAR